MKDNSLLSRTVSTLRFPLMVCVVLAHFSVSDGIFIHGSHYGTDIPHWLIYLDYFVQYVIGQIAVPTFFIFSGYFFFHSGLTCSSYKSKVKKRVRTLLVPYILWNFIFILTDWKPLTAFFSSVFTCGSPMDWTILTHPTWLLSAITETFFFATPLPPDAPLWYIQSLMIIILLSPIFYYIIKKAGWYAVIMLGMLWYISAPQDLIPIRKLLKAAFFFSWGACYAIKGIDFTASMRRFYLAPILYIAVGIADTLTQETVNPIYLNNLRRVISPFVVVPLTAMLIEKQNFHVPDFLSETTFMIFALHWIIMPLISNAIAETFFIDSAWFYTLILFLVPIITIAVCVGVYWLLRKLAPRLCSLLTGGR